MDLHSVGIVFDSLLCVFSIKYYLVIGTCIGLYEYFSLAIVYMNNCVLRALIMSLTKEVHLRHRIITTATHMINKDYDRNASGSQY